MIEPTAFLMWLETKKYKPIKMARTVGAFNIKNGVCNISDKYIEELTLIYAEDFDDVINKEQIQKYCAEFVTNLSKTKTVNQDTFYLVYNGPISKNINNNTIREKAYYLWKQTGSPVGDDLKFWLEAEKLMAERKL